MTDYNVLNAKLSEHISGDLAGESAALFKVNVLSAYLNVGACCGVNSGLKVGERYAGDNFYLALSVCNQGLDSFEKSLSLGTGLVHFPVSGNNCLSEILVHDIFSFIFGLPLKETHIRIRILHNNSLLYKII